MASFDANLSLDTGPHIVSLPPSRRCGKCSSEMRLLGAFPAITTHVAVRIFRCYICNSVLSEQA
jgi:hypothetical protein